MLTEQQKRDLIGQLTAFLHAEIDGDIALVDAFNTRTNMPVLLGCITSVVQVPPRIMGGTPTTAQQIVPIFEFVDPRGENPYKSLDPDTHEVAPSSIIVRDPAEGVRHARDTSTTG